MDIIDIRVFENDYDPNLCCDGGSYYQPVTEIEFSDGSVMVIDDTSCGDFGSRIYVSYVDKTANYGSMLDEDQEWSGFTESDIPMLNLVYERTGYWIPTME